MNPDPGGEPVSRAARQRFLVRGRVQGVGFRAWIMRRGRELGLRGRVRNLSDGTVEVEAEGDVDSMRRLLELLRKGPPLAVVREVRELPPLGDALPPDFDVAYGAGS
jgi:acylphosphatase